MMTKIKLFVVSIIVIVALGIFFISCKKIVCSCTTTTPSESLANDIADAVKGARNCDKVASKLTDKGYKNVSCKEQ